MFKVLAHKFDESFWELGDFPSATSNGTQNVNPWSGAENKNAAPFDQEFFLILNVAVGGTNGYFADDDYPDKPWSNNAENAVADFYKAKDQWLPTWVSWSTARRRFSFVFVAKVSRKCIEPSSSSLADHALHFLPSSFTLSLRTRPREEWLWTT